MTIQSRGFISLLMYNEGEALTAEDLIYESMLILVGGDETTRHVMSRGLEQLLRHPDQMEMLRNRSQPVGLRHRRDAAVGHPGPEHGPHRKR